MLCKYRKSILVLTIFVGAFLGGIFLWNEQSIGEVLNTEPTREVRGVFEIIDDENEVTEEVFRQGTVQTRLSDYRDFEEAEAELTQVVNGLDAPWSFTWLPSGDILVTERFGTLQKISLETGEFIEIAGVPEVFSQGQGGLLDVSLHPDFSQNSFVYLSYAHGTQEANRLRVGRGVFNENELEDFEVLFETADLKSGSSHFGSRFEWLSDGTLVFSVGDGGNPPITYNGELIRERAQYLNSHLGKVIRINDDGTIPEDNPFFGRPDALPEIWSYGHRNIQGFAYDAQNNILYASEHGSKGGDELNQIESGENYGWPKATYSTEYDFRGTEIAPDTTLPNMQDPRVVWTPTIAPSELVYYTGERYSAVGADIFLAGMLLRSSASLTAYAGSPAGAIVYLDLDDSGKILSQEIIRVGDLRVRSIEKGPDGYLYILTDATGPQSRPGRDGGAIWKIESF